MPVKRLDGKIKYPSFGECIYCGASASATELTDEHIIPLSLGGKVVILDGSCKLCAAETTKIEDEISRKVLWDFRLHAKAPTRRKKERPKERQFIYSVAGGERETKTVPIADHPYFTPMPVWGLPGILTGAQPTTEFTHYKAHVFYWIPPNIRQTLGLKHGDTAEIPFPEFRIDHHRVARAIAKIAYCQTVVELGLHGFRHLVLPDLILGRYPCVSHFVGSEIVDPPPPAERSIQHVVQVGFENVGDLQLVVTTVRLFANSGVEEHGPPIYEVVVGARALSQGSSAKRAFRQSRAIIKSVTIPLPGPNR